jgi:predicted amidophosphoribosyltransferase
MNGPERDDDVPDTTASRDHDACPYCRQDHRAGWIYCRSCGRPLTPDPVPDALRRRAEHLVQ